MTVDKAGIIHITAISYDDGIYQGKDPDISTRWIDQSTQPTYL
ncbi:hypothetical protein [Enterobacter cloacae complex sp. 357B1]